MIPNKFYGIASGICIFMMVLCPCYAENLPEFHGTITVEGHLLPEQQVKDLSAFVTIIDVKDLIGSYHDVSQVLDEVAGVKIKRFGGLGNFSTVSIRGSSAEQVMIYLDGILLNKSSGGAVDLSTIPLENIDHIEVFKGMSPSSLGAGSLGGVINIVTRKERSKGLMSFKAGLGSFDTGSFNFHRSKPAGSGSYLVNLDCQRSRSNFSFLDDNGTPFNRNDDEEVRRRNSGFFSTSLLTRYGIHPKNDTGIEFSNLFFYKDQGIPGVGNFQSDDAGLDTIRNIFSTKLFFPEIRDSKVNLKSTFYLSFLKQSFSDENGEIGVGTQDNHNKTWALGGNTRLSFPLNQINLLNLFSEIRYELFTPYDSFRIPEKGSTSSRISLTCTVEDEIELRKTKWMINHSLRMDFFQTGTSDPDAFLHPGETADTDSSDLFFSGKIGTKYRILKNFSLQANAGLFHRIPDFAEMYGNRGFIIGNPFLEPEHSINADLGIDYSCKKLGTLSNVSFQGNYFLHSATDLIQYIQNAQGTARAENLESALIHGAELNFESRFPGMFFLSGNYTLQLSKDTSNIPSRKGNRLPHTPLHEVNLKLRHSLWQGAFEYRFEYISANYIDRANIGKIPHRFFHGLAYKVPFKTRYNITLEAKNLTNNQVEDYRGYPLPGRSFFMNIEMKL